MCVYQNILYTKSVVEQRYEAYRNTGDVKTYTYILDYSHKQIQPINKLNNINVC